jgi:hypothetical protein
MEDLDPGASDPLGDEAAIFRLHIRGLLAARRDTPQRIHSSMRLLMRVLLTRRRLRSPEAVARDPAADTPLEQPLLAATDERRVRLDVPAGE